ncbi:MAG: hypothetical protein GX803_00295 [Lentisphaerae bacterium]|jgi:beta-phosphoglucomutase-like phosphatase (HAD superfamily)|nr:hypothetical protein [Lentisphaerota bacterium]
MAVAKKEKRGDKPFAKSAFIFELDNLALGLRRVRFETLAGILKEQSIELLPAHFSRHCLHPSPMNYMEGFLKAMNAKKLKPEKVVERLMAAQAAHVEKATPLKGGGLVKWMDAALARGAGLACVSMQPQEVANEAAAKLELERWNVQVFSALPMASEKKYPRADHWLRMAKALDRHAKRCLVAVTSMTTAKTALAAMMNVLAVPDEFTEYQDFCGANLVCADLQKVNPNEFFEQISF